MKKFFLLLLIALIVSGCGEDSLTIELPEDYRRAEDSANADVDIYFDATVSMRGFTTLAAGNVYRTLPDILSDAGNSMGAVKFFSFGETVTALDGRDCRKFSSPEPYTEIITAVHNVIDQADAAHLSIIVTDLFESDADWSNISKKIRDKFFANHLAFGIVGIKNSFSGEIFDVGLNAAKFHYDSQDSPRRFRPFYLLIMGREAAVKSFMHKFSERQTLPNETEYLLLSENLSETAEDLTLQTQENFFADNRLKLPDNLREFGIDNLHEDAALTMQFAYKPPLGALSLNFFELKPEVKFFALTGEEWQPLPDARAELTLTPLEENTFALQLRVQPEEFRDGQINFVHAEFAPSESGYLLPDWIGAWSMPNVDANPRSFDGSKTANLIQIASSLKDAIHSATRPAFVKLNFIADLR